MPRLSFTLEKYPLCSMFFFSVNLHVHILITVYYRRINHPNILTIIDTVDINGSKGIITQFIRGRDLSTYLFDEREKIEASLL